MPALKIPDGLTLRVSSNARNKTTTIVAYRKGEFRRAYKAILPMCYEVCREKGPHIGFTVERGHRYTRFTTYHPRDVDALIVKIAKSY